MRREPSRSLHNLLHRPEELRYGKHQELVRAGVMFVSPPQRQFWAYGAEVLDPDGYTNHLWDEATMRRVRQGPED